MGKEKARPLFFCLIFVFIGLLMVLLTHAKRRGSRKLREGVEQTDSGEDVDPAGDKDKNE